MRPIRIIDSDYASVSTTHTSGTQSGVLINNSDYVSISSNTFMAAGGSQGALVIIESNNGQYVGNDVGGGGGGWAINFDKPGVAESTGNYFYYNTLRGDIWVANSNTESENYFNTTSDGHAQGNKYYNAAGVPAYNLFNILDITGDGYADLGTDIPFGAGKTPGYWIGEGFDYAPYTIISGNNLTLPDYEKVFQDVHYSIYPEDYYHTEPFTIYYDIVSDGCNLEYYGWEITRTYNLTTETVDSQEPSDSCGGTISYAATQNGTYHVRYFFKHNAYDEYTPMPKMYNLYGKTGLAQVRDMVPGIMGGWTYFAIALMVSICAAGFVGAAAKGVAGNYAIEGAGVVGAGVLWGFAFLNPWALVIISPPVPVAFATAAVSLFVLAGLYWKQFM
jgi:hypothetical protein